MSKKDQTTKNSKVKVELAKLLEEKEKRLRYNFISTVFPSQGPYRRELYPKHIAWMNAGSKHSQRAVIAANRTGKTMMGAYEMACHLTGLYPDWWKGRKFTHPVKAWAASKSNQVTKEVVQQALLGDIFDFGSGMIPKDKIVKTTKKPGVADAIESVWVSHVSGHMSELVFKSYDQGRETFQGTKKQVIWLDEEPSDYGIFSECLTRTAGDTGDEGIIYCTFTPLFGLSDVVLSFLPEGKLPPGNVDPLSPHKYVMQIEWDEVPHLSKEWKEEALKSYSDLERAARSKGLPQLGSGAIYPYPEDELIVDPFQIPIWWPRAYGLDVGWKTTACIWGAMDPNTKQVYLYSEHYLGQALPAIHASAIKERGEWIWGAVDPRADSRSQVDGSRLLDLYEKENLLIVPADNSVEAGLSRCGQMIAAGQLKVFSTLRNFLAEYRVYRRDEKGKIVKKNDHLMDAFRYFVMTGMEYMECMPDPDAVEFAEVSRGRNDVTGY